MYGFHQTFNPYMSKDFLSFFILNSTKSQHFEKFHHFLELLPYKFHLDKLDIT